MEIGVDMGLGLWVWLEMEMKCHVPNPIPEFVIMTGMLISSLNLVLTRTN